MIPLSVPYIRSQEWELVKQCMDSEWVSYAGSFVAQFERELAAYAGGGHAAGMISGTSALHVALLISGVLPDDEVLLPSLSFVAPANAIRYCHAWPVFIDVSASTWQWDSDQVEDFLRNHCARDTDGTLRNRHTGRRIGAMMPVHLLGGMAELDRLLPLCREFGLPLIEDAAEAFGSRWDGRGIGAPWPDEADISRIICTSFNGNKIMTTGGGGALFANCPTQAARARHLSTTAKTDPVEFDHDEVGYNYRLSNMAAALGVGQLRQMDQFVAKKTANARAYDAALLNLAPVLGSCPETPHVTSNHWLYTLRILGGSRPLLNQLATCSIQTRPLWKPLPELSFLRNCHIHSDQNARLLAAECLSIPCSVGLTDTEQSGVITAITEYLS